MAELPDLLATLFRTDSVAVQQALLEGLIQPEELDPACASHVWGAFQALQRRPELAIPEALLARLSQENLWRVLEHPRVAEHFLRRVAEEGFQVTSSALQGERSTALPPEVEQAILPHLAALPPKVRERVQLSPPGREALLALVRQQAARKAAATRAKAQAKASPKREDPLLEVLRAGDHYRLERFALARLNPKRLEAALPLWRKAPPKVKAYLLRVPRALLSQEVYWEALLAWAEVGCWPSYREPVPAALLHDLSPEGRLTLLEAVLHRRAALDRLPTDDELGQLLLGPLFQNPDKTAEVRNGLRLLQWKEELEALAREEAPPLPAALSRELAFYCQWGCRARREAAAAALRLKEALATWPLEARRAAARIILKEMRV